MNGFFFEGVVCLLGAPSSGDKMVYSSSKNLGFKVNKYYNVLREGVID